MFPTQRLFGLCPDWSTCKLSNCLFSSHTPKASSSTQRPPASTASTPSSSSSTVPQKRPATTAPASGLVVKKVLRTAEPQGANRGSSTSVNACWGTAAGRASGTGGASAGASTSKATLDDVPNAGPPHLPMPKSLSHTPYATRQKMVTTLYTQFLDIYTPGILPSSLRQQLAAKHALAQEEHLFSRSTKATYRNSIISALARLKKRAPARSVDETGTLEEEAERLAKAAEDEKGRLTRKRVAKFVHPVDKLRQFDYPVELPPGPGGDRPSEEGNMRTCDRCKKDFTVRGDLDSDGRQACQFHFGRMVTEKIGGQKQRVYSCCPAVAATPCQVGPHVFKDEDVAALHSRVPFIPTSSLRASLSSSASTSSPSSFDLPPAVDIVALDCEMIYTTAGMSLARVTVVSATGSTLLDEHVRPPPGVAILDLNTRFSGVQSGDIDKAVLDVPGVRRALARFVDEETVFVGHGVENDLKALRLIHEKVIDTAILFPHPNGGTWRHSLRNLAKDILRKFVQAGSDPTVGHSAKEDAETALELVRWKVRQDAAGRG
ncbi:Rexo1 protein [Rhodotorula diobovata]|uniref:Rexo1 protein n=1 Tax=Rhodotorula diobovata TaxID=5288 RepID=A0A5C5G8F7_9BASI|nr:Rexo1 protein [Rhodotorula diobovata]